MGSAIPSSRNVSSSMYPVGTLCIVFLMIQSAGASPTVPSSDLTGSGIDLHSGHVFAVHLTYDGATLAMTISDTSSGASAQRSFPVDIPGTIGSSTAYAGFTGGTGGLTAIQEILSWTYGP